MTLEVRALDIHSIPHRILQCMLFFSSVGPEAYDWISL
jgi:hypothetical protein